MTPAPRRVVIRPLNSPGQSAHRFAEDHDQQAFVRHIHVFQDDTRARPKNRVRSFRSKRMISHLADDVETLYEADMISRKLLFLNSLFLLEVYHASGQLRRDSTSLFRAKRHCTRDNQPNSEKYLVGSYNHDSGKISQVFSILFLKLREFYVVSCFSYRIIQCVVLASWFLASL